MAIQKHIVIVEDDGLLRKSLVSYLSRQDFLVTEFAEGSGVVDFIKHQGLDGLMVDLVICDIQLPDVSGLEIMSQLSDLPYLGKMFISMNVTDEDRIKGLAIGADDYLCKPINPQELLLRINALLRRIDMLEGRHITPLSAPNGDTYQFLGLDLEPVARVLSSQDKQIRLSEKEQQLLLLLLANQGKLVSKDSTIAMRLGMDTTGRAIDILVSRLRKKLHEAAKRNSEDELIVTVRGKGYMLVEA